jgi:hypothetical protein
VLTKARARIEFGRPPGRPGKIGDAVNWEWLLEVTPAKAPLHIISHDGDFESDLYPGQIKEYLLQEWTNAKTSDLTLHKSLLAFLTKCFPDFKLADEVAKMLAIQSLVESFNFAETHKAIARLEEYAVFSDDEITQMIDAMTENSQVAWILSDDDVMSFGEKLIGMAKSEEAKRAASVLEKLIEEIKKPAPQKKSAEEMDDDIPF